MSTNADLGPNYGIQFIVEYRYRIRLLKSLQQQKVKMIKTYIKKQHMNKEVKHNFRNFHLNRVYVVSHEFWWLSYALTIVVSEFLP